MSKRYVAYEIKTTITLRKPGGFTHYFKSKGAAKAAITRRVMANLISKADYMVAEANWFHTNIEKKVEATNLMSGKRFTQAANTPRCCDPSSELYWSM